MKWEVFGKTDVGRVRTNNEDNFLIDPKIELLIVADGMGGHNAGEVASKMAVEVIADSMRRFISNGLNTILGKINPQFSERTNQLASSVRLSNQFIFETAKSNPKQRGMGTTVDCILMEKDKCSIVHVGDSRVYIYDGNDLRQVTQDHSLVADQVRQGLISKEEAEKSQLKNVLTRALGVDEDTDVDMVELKCYDENMVLACTDGLNKIVPDDEILKTIREMKSPKMVVEHLIDLANTGGGVDNVTVIAAKFHK